MTRYVKVMELASRFKFVCESDKWRDDAEHVAIPLGDLTDNELADHVRTVREWNEAVEAGHDL